MRTLVLLMTLALTAPAMAETLTIAPLKGDKGKAAGRQLTAALCRRFTCVKGKKVPDALLTGKVSGARADVSVAFPTHKGVALKRSLGWAKKKLASGDVDALAEAISAAMAPAPPPAPEAAPEPTQSPQPVAEKQPEAAPPPTAAPAPAPVAVVEEPAPAPRTRARAEVPWLVAGVGARFLGRKLSFSGLTSGTVLPYSLGMGVAPGLAVELYPLAKFTEGVGQRLGITFDGALALGWATKTSVPGTQVTYPTSMTQLDVGALMWLGSPRGFSFAPEAAFRLFSFNTSKASDGTSLAGLPDVTYSAIRLGAAVRWVTGDFLTLEVGGSALPMLSAQSLIGSTFFTRGTGFAVEGEGGAWLHFTPHVGIALLGSYCQYIFDLSETKTGNYRASGATDALYGGRALAVVSL